MTKKDALTLALNTVDNAEAKAVYESMIAQLSKPHALSDEAKAKRKEKTANARAEYEAKYMPIVTSAMPTSEENAVTLSDIAEAVPELTEGKIRNLISTMRNASPEKYQVIEKRGERNRYWYKD